MITPNIFNKNNNIILENDYKITENQIIERQKINNQSIIIRFSGVKTIVCHQSEIINKSLNDYIWEKWGLEPSQYYIVEDKNNAGWLIDIYPRIRGGSLFKKILRGIMKAIFAVFKPIVKPLIAIADAFLMLVKGIVYIIMLFTWFLKFSGWFFTEVLPGIPMDIMGMVRFIASMLIDAVVGTLGFYIRKIFNNAGKTVFGASLNGWDNVPDEDRSRIGGDLPNNIHNSDNNSNNNGNNTNEDLDLDCQNGRKCYKTEDGTIPWTVILATVLFPPAGVFMEYGLHGWLQILLCFLLTLAFYFPGLIYSLILLYC